MGEDLKLASLMFEMLNFKDSASISSSLLKNAISLLEIDVSEAGSAIDENDLIGNISKLDYVSGELNVICSTIKISTSISLPFGKGITGYSLQKLDIINAKDVRSSEWSGIYEEYRKETRSEIAIPLFIEDKITTDGVQVDIGIKLIGVLNIESRRTNAFSEEDEYCLDLISRYAAILIDRLNSDNKLTEFRKVERNILKFNRFKTKMEYIVQSIANILEYEFVNVLLVDERLNILESEYVEGIDPKNINDFKEEFRFDISDENIYSSVLNGDKKIVQNIPEADKLYSNLLERYDQRDFIRIMLPIHKPSRDQVIGILEVAHNKTFRESVCERDYRFLENFVEIFVNLLEHEKAVNIDKFAHELRSPIVGIRSHASLMQNRLDQLSKGLIQNKFDDIISDCEILLNKVNDFEYLMGGAINKRGITKPTQIYKDVIIKTVNQVKPIIREYGLQIRNIEYKNISSGYIPTVSIDRTKLNQVVYNIITNAIKYAKEDKSKFRILIDIANNYSDNIVVRIKDWGIGIHPKYKDKIFNQYFRCPEAKYKNVSGSGLGLSISKEIMQEIGGDIILSKCSEPTEFHLLIPKNN